MSKAVKAKAKTAKGKVKTAKRKKFPVIPHAFTVHITTANGRIADSDSRKTLRRNVADRVRWQNNWNQDVTIFFRGGSPLTTNNIPVAQGMKTSYYSLGVMAQPNTAYKYEVLDPAGVPLDDPDILVE